MGSSKNTPPPVWVTDLPVSTAHEGGAPAQFRFRRTGKTGRECLITYEIGGYSASSADVQGGFRTFQIVVPAGQSQTPNLNLHAANDRLVEGDETCWVQINSVSVGSIGSPNRRTVTIVSDDLAVQTIDTPPPALAALTGSFTLAEDVSQGAEGGKLSGRTSGSTLLLMDDAGGRVQLVGTAIQRGPRALDYKAAASHSFTVREVLAGSPNSPRDTVLTLTVTDVADGAALAALSGTFTLPENATRGAEAGTLTGVTAGSTLSLLEDAGGRVQLNGLTIEAGPAALDFGAATSHSFTVREVLAGSPNSPRDSVLTLAVSDVADGPVLSALGGSFTLAEDAAQGTEAGQISGQTPGSTLSLVDDAGGRVQLVGSAIQRGPTALDYEDAASHSFTVREVLAGSPNSPRDTVFTLQVTDVADGLTLNALTGTFALSEDATTGMPAGLLMERTAGSTLSLVDDAGGRLQLVDSEIQRGGTALDYEAAQSHSFTVRETLGGSPNSPRDTVLSLEVINVLDGPVLGTLSGSFQLAENAAEGAMAGAITGKTSASTLELLDDAGGRVALAGNNVVRGGVGLDYEAAKSHSFTIRETLADSPNSPLDSRLTLDVINVKEQPMLAALTGTFTLGGDAAQGASAGTITGTATGSTLSLVDDAGGRVQLVGNVIQRGPAALDYETATTHSFTVREVLGDSPNSPRDSVLTLVVTDATAPTLSSPSGTATSASTATLSATTNEASGTLYWFISTSAAAPGAADLKAGAGAVRAGNQAVSTTGVQSIPVNGLSAATAYYAHFLHRDVAGNDSAIASGASFATPAAPVWVTYAPDRTAYEGGAPARFRFGRTGDTSQECTINYSIGGGAGYTASSDDVQGGFGTFEFVVPAGQAQTPDLELHAIADLLLEGNETCWVRMNSVSVGSIGSPNLRAITLVNDDAAAEKLSPAAPAPIPAAQTLNALTGAFALAEDAVQGAPAGQIAGQTSGSTLSLVDDAGGRVQLVDDIIQRGPTALDYEAASNHSFTVREVLAGSPNSPLDTVLTLAVTDVADGPVLSPLDGSFSLAEDAPQGAPAGQIIGRTTGSTLSLVDDAGGRVQLVGTSIRRGATALDWENATSHSFTVRETLAGATNSPRDTALTLGVSDIAEGGTGAVPQVAPSANWKGTASSGFATQLTQTPEGRATTSAARPVLRPAFADRVAFTGTHRFYFAAMALDTDGTILNTNGIARIEINYEGATINLTTPALHSYTDVNGVSHTFDGFAVDLRNDGRHGKAAMFATAYPRDAAKQPRTIGPFYFYPSPSAAEGVLEIAASPSQVTGSRYKTLAAAATYAASQGWQTWIANITEAGEYNPDTGATSVFNNGRMIIQAAVPGVVLGQSMLGGAQVYDLGVFVSAYRTGLEYIRSKFQNIELRGSNLTIDYRFMKSFDHGVNVYFNGCNIVNSGGRAELWGMGSRPMSHLAMGEQYTRDCEIWGVNEPGRWANSTVNCYIHDGASSLFSGCKLTYGNRVDTWGKDIFWQFRNAVKVAYTGGGGTPSIVWSKSGSTGTVAFKVGTSTVGTFKVNKEADVGFLANNNYRFSHLAAYANSLPGWTMTVDDDSLRVWVISDGKVHELGFTITVSTNAAAPTQLKTFVAMHADWGSQGTFEENVIGMNNLSTGLNGLLGPWQGGAKALDYFFVNNCFEQPAGVNPPFTQMNSPGSHVVYLHNSWSDQRTNINAERVNNCAYACNAVPALVVKDSVTSSGIVDSNHQHSSTWNDPQAGTGGSGQTKLTTSTQGKATHFADPAAGNFTPVGPLASNLKARRVLRDINGKERAAMDAAGATRKP